MPTSNQYRDFRYEDLLPAQLQGLSTTINQLVAQELEIRHGLSLNEWRVMAHVAVNPGTTAQAVAKAANIDKGWVSRSLQGLISRGLIHRRQSGRDARKSLLEVTEEGVGLFDAAAGSIRALQNRLLDAFNADDHEAYIRLTARLQRAAQDLRS